MWTNLIFFFFTLFEHKKKNIFRTVHVRFYGWFEICWTWDWQAFETDISPFKYRSWSCMSETAVKYSHRVNWISLKETLWYSLAASPPSGPNSSKNGKERLQLYFHMSLVRHGAITNHSQPGTMLVDCVYNYINTQDWSLVCCLATSFSL